MNKLSFNAMRGPAVVVIAGLAGGLAEVLWIGASAALLGVDAAHVAREVAATVLPAMATLAAAPWFGLGVHFALSIALAAMFGFVSRRTGLPATPGVWLVAAVALLAGVWAMNFLVVLPWLNPAFTGLLPIGVTFISKLLFAVALWTVFAALARNPPARARTGARDPWSRHETA